MQGFYDWYAPKAFKGSQGRVWDLAWHAKATAFSSELLGALKEDAQARRKRTLQRKSTDWIGTLFSPHKFPAHTTRQETSAVKDGKCFVEVYSAASGKKSAKAAVTAELVSIDGQWVFGNFHYGKRLSEDDNLLATLRILHPNRHNDSKQVMDRFWSQSRSGLSGWAKSPSKASQFPLV